MPFRVHAKAVVMHMYDVHFDNKPTVYAQWIWSHASCSMTDLQFREKKIYLLPHVAQAGLGDTNRELIASCWSNARMISILDLFRCEAWQRERGRMHMYARDKSLHWSCNNIYYYWDQSGTDLHSIITGNESSWPWGDRCNMTQSCP